MKEIKFPFLEHIGAKLKKCGDGRAEVELFTQDYHLQHLGFSYYYTWLVDVKEQKIFFTKF